MNTNATFTEAERQATTLALAELSKARPGWLDYLRRIAEDRLHAGELFDGFRDLNTTDSSKRCTVCARPAPLVDGECPDCRH